MYSSMYIAKCHAYYNTVYGKGNDKSVSQHMVMAFGIAIVIRYMSFDGLSVQIETSQ